MENLRGKFIVIEGTDGSGKATQFEKLVTRLKAAGYGAATFDFPQYDQPSSYFVREYLNGRYGTAEEVGPYKASVFYAVDRFDVGQKIEQRLKEGKMVVINRYVPSNMGHQGAKIADKEERKKFFRWLDEFEYGILGIPRPDFSIILRVPADIAYELVASKGERSYIGGKKRDLHEQNLEHLRRAERVYLEIAELFPKDFAVVECTDNGRLLSIEEIHEKIWKVVKERLPQ